ncbi:MAG: TfoX/Sxy family DNA transformation protein [Caldilineaceae bacterium]
MAKPGKAATSLPKLGPQSTEWLVAVGLHSLADVEQIGVVEAYRRVKAAFPDRVTLNLLYGLQAALLKISWLDLPPEMKDALRAQVEHDAQ